MDAALEAQIKKFSDPLVQTVTQQILEIQGNTQALQALTVAVGGGAGGTASAGNLATTGIGAAVAAGVSGAFEDYGWGPVPTGGKSARSKAGAGSGSSDLQKGVGAGLAAYSIAATGAQQGVNAGNFLGGVLSGASIGASIGGPAGGVIGAIAGGALDLIGGLFHQRSKPTATPQDLNPSYYNAPSGFDVAAYNYSAYGKLPTIADVGFDVKAARTPTINVFVDGAKVAARQEISQQTTTATVSLSNHYRDAHAPL